MLAHISKNNAKMPRDKKKKIVLFSSEAYI